MKSVGHLTTYTVNLEVQSPLFIGSGEVITKKEYLHIPHENKAVLFDLRKLADYLQKKNLMQQYQHYLLDNNSKNIYDFFRNNNIRPQDYAQFTDYTIDMAGASVQGDRPMRELNLFVKDAQGYPYIPGSSLKGALRTAMLVYMIYASEKDVQEKREERAYEWLQQLNECYNTYAIKTKLVSGTKKYEAYWLNRLRLPDTKSHDMVNSVMRGIAVSDSLPIAKEQLMLCQKLDGTVKGKVNPMPLFRECLRPGTVCQFTITIDTHMAAQTGWTMEKIMKAIRFFRQWQEVYFYKKFSSYENLNLQDEAILWFGGGVGFINKTINQASIGTQKALKFNAGLLNKLFPKGHHEKDAEIGISPHIIKVAAYKGKHYPMGQCKLEVLD